MKAKITLTIELEYDLDPSIYPEGMTPEEMVAMDVENYETEPYWLMENDKSVMTVKGEIIKDA